MLDYKYYLKTKLQGGTLESVILMIISVTLIPWARLRVLLSHVSAACVTWKNSVCYCSCSVCRSSWGACTLGWRSSHSVPSPRAHYTRTCHRSCPEPRRTAPMTWRERWGPHRHRSAAVIVSLTFIKEMWGSVFFSFFQLLNSMTECLCVDVQSLGVWRQLYTKHLPQSRWVIRFEK